VVDGQYFEGDEFGFVAKEARYLDIHEDDQVDEERVASRIRQASELPGWVP
jgi:hypothetical protein